MAGRDGSSPDKERSSFDVLKGVDLSSMIHVNRDATEVARHRTTLLHDGECPVRIPHRPVVAAKPPDFGPRGNPSVERGRPPPGTVDSPYGPK